MSLHVAVGSLPSLPALVSSQTLISESPATVQSSSPPSALPLATVNSSITSPLEKVPMEKVPSYAERFKSSLRNLKKISTPTYEEDGIPIVHAPESVLLQTATMWKGHIIAQFNGLIPPSSKIYSDLNPAWGKFGNITIHTLSDTACLIFIPCLSTRDWVLQIGYWQACNCAFSVFPWTPEGLSELSELETAPTWAVLKNVPPQMYSLDGISVIHLDSSPPSSIIVRDSIGNTVRVEVSYPRLPPWCCNCGRFGHLLNRCPKPLMRKQAGKGPLKPFVAGGTVSAISSVALSSAKEVGISAAMVAAVKALPQLPAVKGSASSQK
ncbi:unnamed protein product [Arabidopsis halleri]